MQIEQQILTKKEKHQFDDCSKQLLAILQQQKIISEEQEQVQNIIIQTKCLQDNTYFQDCYVDFIKQLQYHNVQDISFQDLANEYFKHTYKQSLHKDIDKNLKHFKQQQINKNNLQKMEQMEHDEYEEIYKEIENFETEINKFENEHQDECSANNEQHAYQKQLQMLNNLNSKLNHQLIRQFDQYNEIITQIKQIQYQLTDYNSLLEKMQVQLTDSQLADQHSFKLFVNNNTQALQECHQGYVKQIEAEFIQFIQLNVEFRIQFQKKLIQLNQMHQQKQVNTNAQQYQYQIQQLINNIMNQIKQQLYQQLNLQYTKQISFKKAVEQLALKLKARFNSLDVQLNATCRDFKYKISEVLKDNILNNKYTQQYNETIRQTQQFADIKQYNNKKSLVLVVLIIVFTVVIIGLI